ncbi:MAG: hypothetical protein DI538_24500 [Azospira oryzae]|jgi:hypothetical protein|nr:MAG: hypothetical protein DI538_24500 [Azospira oryzae]
MYNDLVVLLQKRDGFLFHSNAMVPKKTGTIPLQKRGTSLQAHLPPTKLTSMSSTQNSLRNEGCFVLNGFIQH